MDDTRTQQALDQLADLFLTGQAPDGETKPGTPKADSGRDDLAGPAPIRLRPKLTENPKPAPPVSYTPPAEDDAPLRLKPEPEDGSPIATIGEVQDHEDTPDNPRREDESQTRDDAPLPAVAVEAVLLGNLPGLSGPWLTQYAQLLAQQEGPVAILHVDDDLVDLELVEPTHTDTPSRGVSLRMPPGGGQIDPRSILEAMLDASGDTDAAPQTVLVHLDPQHDDQGLSRALCIDDWTLMCGADDLAIVGGYKMLKRMVEAEPAVAGKKLGLMIMGSDPKDSQDAARKFQSAAESFLQTPVQLLGWQKQMVPVNLRHLGRFEDMANVWPRLAEWFAQIAPADTVQEAPAPSGSFAVSDESIPEPVQPEVEAPAAITTPPQAVQPEPASATAEPSTPSSSALLDELAGISARPRSTVAPPPAQPAAPATEARPAAPQPQVPRTVQPEPTTTQPAATLQPAAATATPEPEPAPAVAVTPDEPDLVELLMASHGTVPGGIALEARCPHQNQTQLMLDQDGQLHLLARHDSEGFDNLQAAMVDLLQARHWVQEHLPLLALTQRQLKFDGSAEPVLHLFTDRADWATALIPRLGDALKLHLLQQVHVGPQSTWFCTPLN